MDWTGKTIAITGGAGGLGRAFARRFADAGGKVALIDQHQDAVREAAEAVGGLGLTADVGAEGPLVNALNAVERRLGPVDAFIANAGVGVSDGPGWGAASAPDDAWNLTWRVNVMQAVWAARHLVPAMTKRGGGSFVVVASAAGFLNMIGDSPYTATKHAAVSFAESLAIAHGDEGLRVHCLCPEGVRTGMTKGLETSALAASGFIEPPAVADALLKGMEAGAFRIFTHPNTAEYALARVAEPDRWLGGMRKGRRELVALNGGRPL